MPNSSNDLYSCTYRYPFVVPEYFALVTRALIVLEGIAITGDKDFDIFAASYPFARKHALALFGWVTLRASQLLRPLPLYLPRKSLSRNGSPYEY